MRQFIAKRYLTPFPDPIDSRIVCDRCWTRFRDYYWIICDENGNQIGDFPWAYHSTDCVMEEIRREYALLDTEFSVDLQIVDTVIPRKNYTQEEETE
jgi:hypothetical protein